MFFWRKVLKSEDLQNYFPLNKSHTDTVFSHWAGIRSVFVDTVISRRARVTQTSLGVVHVCSWKKNTIFMNLKDIKQYTLILSIIIRNQNLKEE